MPGKKKTKTSKESKLHPSIYQSNPLIQARKEMNTIELRLFMLGLRGINPHLSPNDKLYDTEFKEIFIPTAKLTEILGNTSYLHELDKTCDKLFDAKIKLRFEDGGWELYHLFRKMKYVSSEGLYIHFEDLLRPYLLELFKSRGYTQIDVEQIFHLTSPYAVRLIELMLQYQNIPEMKKRHLIERTLPLDDLRFALNVPEGAYVNRMSHFRLFVLDKPIKEINKKTSYKMSYEVLKRGGTGGRVYGFKFFLDTSALPREEPATSLGSAIEKLRSLGFNEQSARAIRDKCESDEDCLKRIANATRSLAMKKKRSAIENELGYLRKYIEENWQSAAAKTKVTATATSADATKTKRSDQYPPTFKEVMKKEKAAQQRRTSGEPESIKDIMSRVFPTIKKQPEPTEEDRLSLPSPLRIKEPELRVPAPNEFSVGEKPVSSTAVDIAARAILRNEYTETTAAILKMYGLTVERFKELYMR